MDDILEFFVRGIPFNAHLGMEVVRHGDDGCRLRVPFAPHLVGDPFRPAIHGGVISTLADAAGGLAAMLGGDLQVPPDRISTVDLRIDYLRPARLEDLLCDARLVRAGNRVAVAATRVHQGTPDEPVAEGRGVYNLVRVTGS